MKIERVVVNASPLIVLCRSRLDHLLPRLFRDVLVPSAVWSEIAAGGMMDDAVRRLSAASWARRVEVAAIPPDLAPWNLGHGESEVLTLARSLPDHRAMVDDTAARACALRKAGLWLSDDVEKVLRQQSGE